MIINIATGGGRNRARPGLKQLHALFHLMKIGAPFIAHSFHIAKLFVAQQAQLEIRYADPGCPV